MQEQPGVDEIVPLTEQDKADLYEAIQFKSGPSFWPGSPEFDEYVKSPRYITPILGATGTLARILLEHGFEPGSGGITWNADGIVVRARRTNQN